MYVRVGQAARAGAAVTQPDPHTPAAHHCPCAQLQRDADEVQDLLAEARRSYTDEDWAYINRDLERARAERDARRSSADGTTTSNEEQ